MTPDKLSGDLVRETPLLREQQTVREAVREVIDSGLPALPVVNDAGEFRGIFGEREFIAALFPGYLKELSYAGFVKRTLDEAIEMRASCAQEPVGAHMTSEHVDVGPDFSDAQLAETFLHHRVRIIPMTESGQVQGVITRADFFHRLGERFLGHV
jgi:CBS domain-containing protein